MSLKLKRVLRATLVINFVLVPIALAEDSKYPQDEYAKHITAAQTVGAMGNDLFGERVNFFTGATEFRVTDISLPGQGPAVSIGRRFEVRDRGNVPMAGAFADWDLEIPHLHGIFGGAQLSQVDWTVSTAQPTMRCSSPTSDLDAIPPLKMGAQGGEFDAVEYWSGNYLYVPGQGDQSMLLVTSENPHKPMTGLNYRWVTAGQWYFSCIAAANGGGDAFLAVDPAGTRYWFNWIVKRKATTIKKPYGQGPMGLMATTSLKAGSSFGGPTPQVINDQWFLKRQEVWILPTRVEDRFGNTVTYAYSNSSPWQLMQISASDGRYLNLSYSGGVVTSITDGKRVWTYTYSGPLVSAAYPDGSKWSYDLTGLRTAHIQYLPSDIGGHTTPRCDNPGVIAAGGGTGTMTHPSGAIGTFSVSPVRMGRSYVPKTVCWAPQGGGVWYARESLYPVVFDNLALVQKQVAGPGQAAIAWSYVWGPANSNYIEDCVSGQCPSTRTLTINAPDGNWVRYTHSNRFFDGEGELLLLEEGASGSNSPLSTTQHTTLNTPTGQNYPARIGIDINPLSDKVSERYRPQVLRQIRRQDRIFTWQVAKTCGSSGAAYCLDQFARPTRISKSSAPAP